MNKTDPKGYDALISNYDSFCRSNVDPVRLAQMLIQRKIIDFEFRETVEAKETSSEKLGVLLDKVLRNGDPRTYEEFMTCLSSDASVAYLANQIKDARRQIGTESCENTAANRHVDEPKEKAIECGCGECDLQKLLTEGCQKETFFPYLRVNKLSTGEYQYLEKELQQHSREIEEALNTVKQDCRKWIKKYLTVPQFREVLTDVEGTYGIKMLSDYKDDLDAADTHVKLMKLVYNYTSWYNYTFLQHVMKHSCKEVDQKEDELEKIFTTYQVQLLEFCKRFVFECPPPAEIHVSSKEKYIVLKVDARFEKLTLTQVKDSIQHNLLEVLDIYPHALNLRLIREGCTELVYVIPRCVYSVAFPLHNEQCKVLSQLRMQILHTNVPSEKSITEQFSGGTSAIIQVKEMEGRDWKDILEDVPQDDFICPIAQDLLINPYITSCGHHFNEDAIRKLQLCPLCRTKLTRATTSAKVNSSIESEPQKSKTKNTVEVLEHQTDYDNSCCGEGDATASNVIANDDSEDKKGQMNEAVPDEALKKIICTLKVRCPLEGKGCTWVGQIRELHKHLKTQECQYKEFKCPYLCDEIVCRGLLEMHMSSDCPKRPHVCPYCKSIESTYDDVTTKHIITCADSTIDCPNKCGKTNIQRKGLKEHFECCPNETTNCKYFYADCNVKETRQLLEKHYLNFSEHHYRLIDKYSIATISTIKKIQAEDRLMEYILTLNVCHNYPMFTMEHHLWHKNKRNSDHWFSDPFYTGIPGYKLRIGFDAKKPDKHQVLLQLMKGEFDNVLEFPFCGEVAVQLGSETVGRQQQLAVAFFKFCNVSQGCYGELVDCSYTAEKHCVKNNKLVFHVTKVTLECMLKGFERSAQLQMEEHIDHFPCKVEECSYCYMVDKYIHHNAYKSTECILGPLSGQLNHMITALEQQQKVLDKIYSAHKSNSAVYQPLVELKMENYQHYYKYRQAFRSEPFFTHFGGYKMHLRVDGYGEGKELGHHLCVAVVLMKGPFDDMLKFPFHGEITVQLFKEDSKVECAKSKFIFSNFSADKVTNEHHNRCYEKDNGLENNKFISLNEVKMCNILHFKIANVVVDDSCSSMSSDSTVSRLDIQRLYIQDQKLSETDVFFKKLKLERKSIQQKSRLAEWTKMLKYYTHELQILLIVTACAADILHSISPLFTAIILLITCIILTQGILCMYGEL